MRNNGRLNQILELLDEYNYLSVQKLANACYVSLPTIRRDLIILEKEGKIIRSHGGATYVRHRHNEPIELRDRLEVDSKKYIANLAKKYVDDGSHLFFDVSSTSLYLARELLDKRDLRILSNSLVLTQLLSQNPSNHVECTGGIYDPASRGFSGYESTNFINKRRADIFFVSSSSFDESGVSGNSASIEPIHKAFKDNASKVILLMDHSKIGVRNYYHIMDLKDIDILITDKKPSDSILKACKDNNIEVIY